MERWHEELVAGRAESAWDLFLADYRRLLFAAIRHYTRDPDDVMDVFAHVCEQLRRDDLSRLRRYTGSATTARFSTWLVAVVHNLTVDWFRRHHGRRRRAVPAGLSPLQQQIYEHVFIRGDSHEACYQRLRLSYGEPLSSHEFSVALTTTYRLVQETGGEHGALSRAAPDLPIARTPEDHSLQAAAAEELAALLDELDPADRLAIQLFVIDELGAAEVARIVGWPNAKMVYNRVSRALAALRKELGRREIRRSDL